MHLPDGIVSSPAILVGAALVSAGVVSASVTRVAKSDRAQQLAWTGTLAAFALAVQAVNVPAAPGVSAHALGASLLTLLLGPASAVLALATVVLLQALLF
ncbi:MAG TPA: energy-coupling factor ABC transporter permease, partial [Polyangiaceae bacterium]|nr:energy-coupling factor ABC transporter permease [Polyangiaceae bacterium]